MNSLERVMATTRFQRADRVPVIPQILGHAAVLAGVPLGDYVRDGALAARCQMEAWRHYGHDTVFGFLDACVEAEAMGAVVAYHEHRYAQVVSNVVAPDTALDHLTVPDPQAAGRMPELLRAIAILRAEVGGEVPVIGIVLGPMTLAVQFMGAEQALYLAVDQPERFERLLDFTTRFVIRHGLAQLEAGAHLPMVFDPAASPAVVPPEFFRSFALPCLRRIFPAFKEAGAAANWLHIAGPVEPILAYYPEAGADIANLDYSVDPERARQILPRTCLDGNIKPVAFVLGSAQEVGAEARRLVDLFADRGGFVLSSGCEIPPEAKPENIAAMIDVVRH